MNLLKEHPPVSYDIHRGGSSHGFSKRVAIVDCPRRASRDANLPAGEPSSGESKGTREGTMGHAFLDLYYGNKIARDHPLNKIELTLDGDPLPPEFIENRAEAERVSTAYLHTFPRNELGRVLGTEIDIPDSPKVRKAVYSTTPYTARLDLATKITEKQCAQILITRSADIEPGEWITDHKFLARRSGYLVDEYLYRLQFTAYMLAWEAHFGQRPQGLLANIVFKTKSVGLFTLAVPFPDEDQKNALHAFMFGAEIIGKRLPDWPNASNCFSWNRPCPYLLDFSCKRG
jgi:hypothetical protein